MNTKRQTVWLVSMLGLMVVLSAYYLFTDDMNEVNTASESGQHAEETIGGTDSDPMAGIGEDVWEISEGVWEEWKTDEQILEEFEAQETSAHDYFTMLHMQRLELFSEEIEEQMAIINDAASTDSAIQIALEEYNRLEEIQSKITGIEEQLMRDFEDAIITEDEGAWQVMVKTSDLEKSEAVSILDLVTEELGLQAAAVRIQYRN